VATALAFSVLVGPLKQWPAIYTHAPWQNDPYDTAVSFAMLFVPLVLVLVASRLVLCRRYRAVATVRLRDLVRGCRCLVLVMAICEATEWIAVGLGANRAAWDGWTAAQVTVLSALTMATSICAGALSRISILMTSASTEPDWLEDVVTNAPVDALPWSIVRQPVEVVRRAIEVAVTPRLHRHPVVAAAGISLLAGVALGLNQSLRENYSVGASLMIVVLLAVGLFGLLTVAGGYLHLVRGDRSLAALPRHALESLCAASILVLIPFALRLHLWWVVGSTNKVAGLGSLAELTGLSFTVVFLLVLVIRSLAARGRSTTPH
jgi:hypothetical protein